MRPTPTIQHFPFIEPVFRCAITLYNLARIGECTAFGGRTTTMPSESSGGKPSGFRKIQIDRHHGSTDCFAGVLDRFVRASRQTFGDYRSLVEALLEQFRHEPHIEVFIEFQLQADTGSVRIGKIRSRDISAAKANAARMSSGLSCG